MMLAPWAASELVAIARGSNRSGTSMGPRSCPPSAVENAPRAEHAATTLEIQWF